MSSGCSPWCDGGQLAGAAGEGLGSRVALGELDGDGRQELLAVGRSGVWTEDGLARPGAGVQEPTSVFLLQGPLPEVSDLGSAGWRVELPDASLPTVVPAGDLDRDGMLDWVVGVPGDDELASGAGTIWVIPGSLL